MHYFLNSKKVQHNAARLIFRATRSAHITPMLHWLPSEQRSNTSCPRFTLRSFLIRPSSAAFQNFTFTQLPGSSALLQTPECSEHHQSFRTRSFQAPVIWDQHRFCPSHSTSVGSFQIFFENFSLFNNLFFSSIALTEGMCVSVCV